MIWCNRPAFMVAEYQGVGCGLAHAKLESKLQLRLPMLAQ
jgi:hypothetical protein